MVLGQQCDEYFMLGIFVTTSRFVALMCPLLDSFCFLVKDTPQALIPYIRKVISTVSPRTRNYCQCAHS